MPPEEKTKKYNIQSVENALDILEALGNSQEEEFRISQLAKSLPMNKATIFRLLATFEKRGYVEKGKSGEYRIGTSAFELGQKMLLQLSLLQKAKPVMERLARKCNEAVYLCIRKGAEVLLLEMVDCMEHVKVVSLLGSRFPLDKVSAGIVLVDPVASGDGPASAPPAYAADFGGFGAGIVGLAVHLRNGMGRVCGSLCLIGPEFRFTTERIDQELRPNLQEAGSVISSRLGYFGPDINRVNAKSTSFYSSPAPFAGLRECTFDGY